MKHTELQWRLGDLTERKLEGKAVFDGGFLHVKRDIVELPDGKRTQREYIVHPGAAAIIAITDSGELVMERQYRYPLEREFLELPAGKIDPGEDPLETAKRELLEETGYTARQWRHLGVMHPVISYSTERIEMFLAQGLSQSSAKLDQGEFLEVFTVALPTAMDWIRSGRITDSKTIAGLLWAEKLHDGAWA
ncbi:MAG: NUDIX domain-containing protein [Burkholderiales bacterium]